MKPYYWRFHMGTQEFWDTMCPVFLQEIGGWVEIGGGVPDVIGGA